MLYYLAFMLTAYERTITRAVFDALLPGVPGRAPAARDHDLLASHVAMLAAMPRAHALGFRAGFVAAEFLVPLLTLGKPARLSRLSPPAREAALHAVVYHPRYLVRQLGLLFKTAAGFAYFQQPGVRDAFGLPPVADPGVK